MSTTPNMNLTLPVVSQTTGPLWASQINSDLSVIDAHNHIPSINGGVAITTAALDIDADLSFNTYSALSLSSAEFVNQAATPSASRVYITGGNLWYSYDGVTPVQITSGTSIASATGNITGLAAPAAVIYDNATSRFTFWSNQSINAQAILAASQFWVRASITAGIVAVAGSPSSSTYTLTLPTTTPGGAGLVGFANSGALSPVLPDSTLSVTSSTIGVAALGIGASQIASSAVTTVKINDKAVTQVKMEDKSTSGATASGTNLVPGTVVFSSFTVNLTAGRPVLIMLDGLQNTGTAPAAVPAAAYINCTGTPSMYIAVTHPNGTTQTQMGHVEFGAGQYSPSSVQAMFNVVSSGTHTIQLASFVSGLSETIALVNGFFKAFQL